MSERVINRMVPWFGANAANAGEPARLLADRRFVYVPFLGSGAELPHFAPSVQVMASDVHDDLITLFRVVKDSTRRAELVRMLEGLWFHPEVIESAHRVLADRRADRGGGGSLFARTTRVGDVEVAAAWFIVAWMGRSGVIGTRGETALGAGGRGLALRYDAGGGDPVTRFGSAVASLDGWAATLSRCQFTREDVFEVLGRLRVKLNAPTHDVDAAGNRVGIYCDPPWPDDGAGYLHAFGVERQRRLARELVDLVDGSAGDVAVVVRFGEHPLIRELYGAEAGWTWHAAESVDQHRGRVAEWFIERRPA